MSREKDVEEKETSKLQTKRWHQKELPQERAVKRLSDVVGCQEKECPKEMSIFDVTMAQNFRGKTTGCCSILSTGWWFQPL